jgi:ribosomal protein S18 acetylase RimI-like enzyme
MTVTYRTATPDDAATLSELGTATFIETFGHLYSKTNLDAFLVNHSVANWAAELADPAYAVRLAEADGAAIGYAKLGPPHLPFDPGDRVATELRQLYVVKGWHGSGVAVALTDWIMATARDRGAQDIYLSVFTQNPRAQAFYRRYGFVAVGEYSFMVGDHADTDLVMKAALDV